MLEVPEVVKLTLFSVSSIKTQTPFFPNFSGDNNFFSSFWLQVLRDA